MRARHRRTDASLSYCPICGNDLGPGPGLVHTACRVGLPAHAKGLRDDLIGHLTVRASKHAVVIRQPPGRRTWEDLA